MIKILIITLFISGFLYAETDDINNQKLKDEFWFYLNQKDYDKAIPSIEKYLKNNQSPFYEYQLGKAYLFSGKNLKKAEQIYTNFIKNYDEKTDYQGITPPDAYWRLGMVYEAMGNLKKAKETYQKGVELQKVGLCSKALKHLGENTDFNKKLTMNEKLSYFFKIWHYANDFFVFFDQIDLNWEKVKMDFLPRVQDTKDNESFYWLMTEMLALLKDGHTNAYAQGLWKSSFIQTKITEDNVYFIKDNSYRKNNMTPGDKILEINGLPVLNAIENAKKYISSSTPQWTNQMLENYGYLINFNHKDHVTIKYDHNGKIYRQKIAPSPQKDKKDSKAVDFKKLENNIGYIAVNSMYPDNVGQFFDVALDSLFNTKALIIDIRKNGGGNSNVSFHILSRILPKKLPFLKYKVRLYTVDMFDRWFSADDEFDIFYDVYQNVISDSDRLEKDILKKRFLDNSGVITPKPPLYDKPIVVLIGPRTFSAAEDFLAPLHGTNRVTLIGKPTGGSTGQPLMLQLNGELSARICSRKCWCSDGYEFVGKGFIPDIEIDETLDDILSGKDKALEKAIQYLGKIQNK